MPAAEGLTALLSRRRRAALGAFLPAGFPNWTARIEALRAFVRHGADFLEVGVPHRTPAFDGPDVSAAYTQALEQGTRMAHVFSTIRLVASSTDVPVVAMAYWTSVCDFGIERFAQADAAGAMVPDLPLAEAGPWLNAAREAGTHTPQFAPRGADDSQLRAITDAASGWVYVPAAAAPTGYQGPLDLPGLHDYTTRLRATTSHPLVAGIGISTPERAAEVAPFVDAVAIGSPLVRPLLHTTGPRGLEGALEQVRAFAYALRTPAAPATLLRDHHVAPRPPQRPPTRARTAAAHRHEQSHGPAERAEEQGEGEDVPPVRPERRRHASDPASARAPATTAGMASPPAVPHARVQRRLEQIRAHITAERAALLPPTSPLHPQLPKETPRPGPGSPGR
ncbi:MULTISPECIES: tryptophan synthase subunit alpha [Streptomyces]|uniref:tryptophan synthase subunit alpha n=1 Tax=Streptomyces TaxID=1883 RepID=UPI0031E33DB5